MLPRTFRCTRGALRHNSEGKLECRTHSWASRWFEFQSMLQQCRAHTAVPLTDSIASASRWSRRQQRSSVTQLLTSFLSTRQRRYRS